jgi:hypothetical protein
MASSPHSNFRRRALLVLLILNLAATLTALGWLAWISASPRYWFPDAYAQKGDRGDPGPRGPRGRIGPQGPLGDTAEGAVADLDSRVTDLEDSVGTLQSDLDDLQNESGVSTLESDVQDATTKLDDICTALSGYGGAFEDIYISAC